ncbi:MAG: hypothetical protein NWS20_04635 [Rickettsiaceae bacterium]|nr:hypothetical protein [Rickettsiaceae bacterium]MDP4832853.1 hypothetical protein [Rickettsiaceae bacterium]
MSIHRPSKLEFLVKFFNNIFHKRKLIVFIGVNGIIMATLKWQKIQDSIFISNIDEHKKRKYHKFLNKYKKYYITFLLDSKECVLKHEIMPIFNSLIKTNPVDKFISENYASSDIVAYNVYRIDHQDGEIWNSCIASVPFREPISKLLKYVINNSFKYSGVYFLSLEFQTIIDKILQITHNTTCNGSLQIFATVTQSSDIRIVVKYKQDIMHEQCVEYPQDKSPMYIIGTIEQVIADKLLFYREYIRKLNLQTCVILLVNEELKALATNLKFGESQIILLSGKDLSSSKEDYTEQEFQDHILIEKFDSFNTHLALNKALKSITQLTLINSVIFKPLLAVMLGLSITLAALKYQTIIIQSDTSKLNKQYYALSEEYRTIQKQQPELANISDLVDLYNLENMIKEKSAIPFTNLKALLSFNSPDIQISNIKWEVDTPKIIGKSPPTLEINVSLFYKGDSKAAINGVEIINEYVNHIKSTFQDYKVNYKRNTDDIIEIAGKIIIPADITITGSIKGDNNAR